MKTKPKAATMRTNSPKQAEAALQESEERFRQLSEAAFEAIILHDNGTILEVNQSFCRMYGYERAEVIGKSVLDLALPKFRKLLLQRVRSGETEPNEGLALRKDGTIFRAEVAAKPIYYQGRSVRVAAIRDITEQKRNERRQAAQNAVTQVLADSATFAEATPQLLKVICESLRWKMGEFWRLCNSTNVLRCVETWHVPELDATTFIEASRQTELPPGVGLPGRVWQSGQTEWIPDVTMDPRFARSPIAAKVGLRGAVGFPILLGNQTLGVMLFFSRRDLEIDKDLLKILSAIGSQIGQFTERKRAEAALNESEERYRDLVENSREMICTHDLDGRVLSANRAAAETLGYVSSELLEGKNIRDILAPEVRYEFEQYLASLSERDATSGVMLVETITGERRVWEYYNSLRTEGVAAPIVRGMARDITERKRAEAMLASEKRLLEMIVNGASLSDILDTLVREIEKQSKGLSCSILLLDADGEHLRHGAAPSLPDAYCRAIDGIPIGPCVGSCGTAAFRQEPVVVDDIATDPLWKDCRELALEHGLCACWSTPILTADSSVLGTFAMYYREPLRPGPKDLELIDRATQLAAIAIERRHAEQTLSESERRYRDIFTFAPVGIYQSSRDGTLITANQALAEMLGYASVDELLSVNLGSGIYSSEEEREKLIKEYESLGYAVDLETQWKRKDGSSVSVQLSAQAIKGPNGETKYFEGFVRDITEQKRAMESLTESEERYRDLVENAIDVIYAQDLDGNFTSVNRAAEKITGYTKKEILAMNKDQFVAPEYLEKTDQMIASKLAGKDKTVYELEIIAKDDRRIAVEINTRIIYENGAPVRIQGIARDITESKRAEMTLNATAEQLRSLSARLRSAREDEGTRIAREIHDELGAALTGLKWDLEGIEKVLSRAGNVAEVQAVRKKLPNMTGLIDSTIDTVRRISAELRPGGLDDLGLVAAIEWQASQLRTRTGIKCKCVTAVNGADMSRERATTVFRIFQEILTNITRHSNATKVKIELTERDKCLELRVKDNGRGITREEKQAAGSLGLLGMSERARQVGGEVSISGVQGKGTTVVVRVPTV